MRKIITLLILISITSFNVKLTKAQSWQQIGNDIEGEAAGDEFGYSTSLSSDGSIVAIGAPNNDGNSDNLGHVKIYEYQDSKWKQMGDEINGKKLGEKFGSSVRLSSDGSKLAVYGKVCGRIYENLNNTWKQMGDSIDVKPAGYKFEKRISLNSEGSIVAIGYPGNDMDVSDAGYVKIFKFSDGNWTQIGDDIEGEAAGDEFGYSTSLNSDGSIVAIGAPYNDGNSELSGHVRIYENQNGTWTQIGDDIDGEGYADLFGSSVHINANGTIVAIGAAEAKNSSDMDGYVKVYKNQNGTWTQIGDNINGEYQTGSFGTSISINDTGSVLAIGDPQAIGDIYYKSSGHVKIYKNQDGTWTQIGDDINGDDSGDRFGCSVSLNSDGSILAIGAKEYNPVSGTHTGRVKVYKIELDKYINILNCTTSNESSSSGSFTIAIESNADWSVDQSCEWVSVSPSSGTGNESVTVSYEENTNTGPRSCNITVAGSNKSDQCDFTQNGADEYIKIKDCPTSNVNFNSDRFPINVESNVDWSVDQSCEWVSVSPSSGTGNESVTVSYEENTNTGPRSCNITITGSNKSKECEFIQKGEPTYIDNISHKDGTIKIYPNPLKNRLLYIQPENIDDKMKRIVIYNSVGTKVKTLGVNKLNPESTEVELSSFKPGIYFITLKFENEIIRHKIIID